MQKILTIYRSEFRLPEDFKGTALDALKLMVAYLEEEPVGWLQYARNEAGEIDRSMQGGDFLARLLADPEDRIEWSIGLLEVDSDGNPGDYKLVLE